MARKPQPTAAGQPKKAPAKDAGPGIQVVARNRKARHQYDIVESVECGIVLTGTEVKSLRAGKLNLETAYGRIDGDEVFLMQAEIQEYLFGNRANHDPKRKRKLLLRKREIVRLKAATAEKGLTLVPLQVHFRRGFAKVDLAVAKGRRDFDKRHALKAKDAKREVQRELRRH